MADKSLEPRVSERVAASLKNRILSGYYPDGVLPPQPDLVEEFNISPPSLREALRILAAEGLVIIRRGRLGGAETRRPDASTASLAVALALQSDGVTLADLAEALRTLEPISAVDCALRSDRVEVLLPQLEANLEESEAAIGGPEFTHRAREFHQLIVDHTATRTTRLLTRTIVAIWSAQEETWARSVAKTGSYPDADEQRAALRAHQRIASDIAAGNTTSVERVARRHIEVTQQRTLLAEFGDHVVDATSPLAVTNFRNFVRR